MQILNIDLRGSICSLIVLSSVFSAKIYRFHVQTTFLTQIFTNMMKLLIMMMKLRGLSWQADITRHSIPLMLSFPSTSP